MYRVSCLAFDAGRLPQRSLVAIAEVAAVDSSSANHLVPRKILLKVQAPWNHRIQAAWTYSKAGRLLTIKRSYEHLRERECRIS